MELYIPENLKRINVISQLCTMIENYASYYKEDPASSFDDYDFYLSYDPVKAFIGLCIPEDEFDPEREDRKWDPSQDYNTIINYLSRLFYSVKGTKLVLDYMKKYLDLTFIGEIIYTPGYIKFTLDTLNINDEHLFRDLLEGFLNALLFFSDLEVNVGRVELRVDNKITSYIQGGAITYTYYPVDQLDDVWQANIGNNL